MCGFGEKDRRPIDPPPIVQLIVDEPNYDELWAPPKPIKPIKPKKKKGKKKGAKKGRKPGKKALALAAAAAAAEEAAKAEAEAAATQNENKRQRGEHDDDEDEEGHDSHDEESEDDQQEDTLYELDDDEENDEEDVEGGDHNGESSSSRAAGRTRSSSMSDIKPTTAGRPTRESNKEEAPEGEDKTSTPPQPPKRRGRPARNSDIQNTVSAGKKHSRDMDDASGLAGAAPVIEEEESDEEQEWPRYEGGAKALRQDPLYVLHVSLWSEDGSEVRSMIATPGQTEPPKLTRILMGAVVVSPILLNNERGEPGWYFSFPDLSIRTEGVYTLKFSLMRFAFFDFDDLGGSHASTIIAEELSQPFTVFSAKKFPGMTESTELSKAFAKQGLKIPIRNDLRVRKTADKD
ncbi:hypothetical protein BGZ58_006919 [Dissophora ornata]|nr:hypothetical protein BGZ58_006919 [Dissophora ornata]